MAPFLIWHVSRRLLFNFSYDARTRTDDKGEKYIFVEAVHIIVSFQHNIRTNMLTIVRWGWLAISLGFVAWHLGLFQGVIVHYKTSLL
jgi:hypothetical protein